MLALVLFVDAEITAGLVAYVLGGGWLWGVIAVLAVALVATLFYLLVLLDNATSWPGW